MSLFSKIFESSNARSSSWPATVALVLAIIFGVLLFSFVQNKDCLEIGIDGALFSGYLEKRPSDHVLFTQTGVDPLRGGFDAFYPLVREYLVPGFLTLPFAGSIPGKSMAYFLYTPVLIFAFYMLARVLAIEWPIAVLAGFLCSVFLLPGIVHHFGEVQGNLHLNPHWSQNIFLSLLIVASFWALDGKWRLKNALLLFAPLLCLILTVISTGPQLFFMLPALAFYAAASLLDARRISDDLQRILAASIAVLGLAVLGIATYYYSLVQYTPFHFFSSGLKEHPVAWHLVSAYFWIEPLGRWAIILGILGAVWTVLVGSGRLRLFAGVHLLVKLVYFPIAYWIVFLDKNYHGSMPSYFELFILLFDLLFAAILLAAAVRSVGILIGHVSQHGAAWVAERSGLIALTAVVASVGFYNVSEAVRFPDKECPARGFNPLKATAITDILRRESAIKPGLPFRGLAATVTGVDDRPSVTWEDLHAHDYWLWRAIGNDHRSVGLWDFGIPTLFQLFTFTAPPYFLLVTDFLARPTDVQTRSELVLTKINEPMMQLWGVRYLITDRDDAPGKLVTSLPVDYTLPTPKRETLRLFEFPEPNLGNYSPTKVLHATDFHSGLAAMHQADFNGKKTVLTDAAIDGNFVPASGVKLTYQKYGFDLHAESVGQSIVVLPVVYSHCWSVNNGSANLFRANLMQLGVSFHGALDARLVFRYGPILASGCRLDDLNDMQRLNLNGARPDPPVTPPKS